MNNQIQTILWTNGGVRIHLDQYDDDNMWLQLFDDNNNSYAVLTRAEGEQLLINLQRVLAKEDLK